ncbi:MAG: glycosyltransferase [Acidobacteria bacterium]|nr:glycosyltransferase [Acidobacteriota bacterium]
MRIAFFSPVNPQPSGISDYSEALLQHFAPRVGGIDLFIEDYRPAASFAAPNLRIRPWKEFEPDYRAGQYDAVLYHIGNNPFHVYIYDLALRIPGVLVLHEFNLHYLVAHATVARQDWDAYLREVEHDAGPAAVARARQAQASGQQLDYDNVALNRTLLERSRAAIVHSEYMVGLLRGAGFRLPVRRISHGAEIPSVDRTEARRFLADRAGFDLADSTPVFGIFGFLKPYKRIHQALRALACLRSERPEVKMILAGEEHPHYPLRPLIADLGLEDAVRILGYLPVAEFTTSLAAADYCINLRRPTAGETSGSFLRALGLGKPTLVSEIGSFLDFPAEVAIRIPVDDREEKWLYEYMKVLLDDPQLGRAIGEAGRAYVQQTCLWPQVADQYVQFLKECVMDQRAPVMVQSSTAEVGSANGKPPHPALSEEELAEYIVGFSHVSKLMEEYVLTHLKRLVRTVQMTPAGGPEDRVLELGCYLQITPALRRYLGYGEVRGAYYGRLGEQAARCATSITGEVFSCLTDLFDAERDRFPYSDEYFCTVLCCELVEHLSTDPMHMMAEINRILAPGGHLVLTTPNIASFRSVYAVLHGYHPGMFPAYIKPSSGGTVDPRHAREYAPREIALLVEAAGFRVELLETGGYSPQEPDHDPVRRFLELNNFSTQLRGEAIYCLARKTGPVRDRWPQNLYYP